MNAKRVLSLLLAVVVTAVVMPLTASAATIPFPITNWKNVKGWYHSGTDGDILPATLTYDFILVRYFTTTPGYYYIFFCNSSAVAYNSSDGCYRTISGNTWMLYVYPDGTAGSGWDYYPDYIGYAKAFNSSNISKLATNMLEARYEKSDFPFVRVATPTPPPDPPDPPDPPKPEVPPMVIPPHNPEMVPWNESKMDEFFTYVSNATGNIVTVGLGYFGLILAVYVVIRILKTFEGVSSGEG